jgi:glycosyltransferase involved in cell wall biosynthesis
LVRRGARRGPPDPPAEFRVLATITTYNEADVIVPSVRALLDQDVEVHLIDNWSTDGTPELVAEAFGGRITVERFPRGGPTGLYQLGDLLTRISEIARNSDADWIIHHDADERRHGPWSGLDLRAALYRVEMEGYNAVNHTVIDFPPVDDEFPPGGDFEEYFTRFSPNEITANRIQIKAWKGRQVDLRSSGGHEAIFPGRRVHPFNFLLKHYPVRSQAQGERKVLGERKPRVASNEKGRWHTHYDHVRSGHVFLRDPNELMPVDDDFSERWLLERLYGFPRPGIEHLPAEARRAVSEILRGVGLLESARSVRRRYRVARRRHPDTGRR